MLRSATSREALWFKLCWGKGHIAAAEAALHVPCLRSGEAVDPDWSMTRAGIRSLTLCAGRPSPPVLHVEDGATNSGHPGHGGGISIGNGQPGLL